MEPNGGHDLSRVIEVLQQLEQRLGHEQRRFDDPPPPYSSGDTTQPPSPPRSPPEINHVELRNQVKQSLPGVQFNYQVDRESRRMDEQLTRISERHRRTIPTRLGVSHHTLAEENIERFWREQDIWSEKWKPHKMGRHWKHETLPDAPPLTEEQQAAHERNTEASRPYRQFEAQIAKERIWLQDEKDPGGFDIGARAYEVVKQDWIKQGIWRSEWGDMPGRTWKHEDDEEIRAWPERVFPETPRQPEMDQRREEAPAQALAREELPLFSLAYQNIQAPAPKAATDHHRALNGESRSALQEPIDQDPHHSRSDSQSGDLPVSLFANYKRQSTRAEAPPAVENSRSALQEPMDQDLYHSRSDSQSGDLPVSLFANYKRQSTRAEAPPAVENSPAALPTSPAGLHRDPNRHDSFLEPEFTSDAPRMRRPASTRNSYRPEPPVLARPARVSKRCGSKPTASQTRLRTTRQRGAKPSLQTGPGPNGTAAPLALSPPPGSNARGAEPTPAGPRRSARIRAQRAAAQAGVATEEQAASPPPQPQSAPRRTGRTGRAVPTTVPSKPQGVAKPRSSAGRVGHTRRPTVVPQKPQGVAKLRAGARSAATGRSL